MNKSNKYSLEVRERAVRMVLEQRGEYPAKTNIARMQLQAESGVSF
ncbi:MAG: hypothetical protein ACK4N4_11045 [Burkholderiales bacterium]